MRLFLKLGMVTCAALATAACEEGERAGIMLMMRTDMAVPEPVDSVGVYLEQINGSKRRVVKVIEVKASEDGVVRLPGTLAVNSDRQEDTRLRVRMVGYDKLGTPLAMREARVAVPTVGVKVLRLPLLWLNTDDVDDKDPSAGGPRITNAGGMTLLQEQTAGAVDAFARFRSDYCGDEQTLDDQGACAPIDIVLEEDWVEETETGGGSRGPGGPVSGSDLGAAFCARASCFDLYKCVHDALEETEPNLRAVEAPIQLGEKRGECFVDLDELGEIAGMYDPQRVSLTAVMRSEADPKAFCLSESDCFMPIEGALAFDANGRMNLPPGVCRKSEKAFEDGKPLQLLLTPLCVAPAADKPVCANVGDREHRGGSCLDGTGWDGNRPQVVPSMECAKIGGINGGINYGAPTGMWVSDVGVTVVTNTGTLFPFAKEAIEGVECVTAVPTVNAANLDGTSAFRLAPGSDGKAKLFLGLSERIRDDGDSIGYLSGILPENAGVGSRNYTSESVIGGGIELNVSGKSVAFFLNADGRLFGEFLVGSQEPYFRDLTSLYGNGTTGFSWTTNAVPRVGGWTQIFSRSNESVWGDTEIFIVDCSVDTTVTDLSGVLCTLRTSSNPVAVNSYGNVLHLESYADTLFAVQERAIVAFRNDDKERVSAASLDPVPVTMQVAVTPDGKHVFVGENHSIRVFDVNPKRSQDIFSEKKTSAGAPVTLVRQNPIITVQAHKDRLYWLEAAGDAAILRWADLEMVVGDTP